MRTSQYSLVLVVQVLMLCAMFTLGGKVVDYASGTGTAGETSDVGQPGGSQGLGDLYQHLAQ